MPTLTPSRSDVVLGRERRKAKLLPTLPIGAPVKPIQRIPEPVVGVGALTGAQHFIMGDNPAGPEQVAIQPPAGSPQRAQIAGGLVSYAEGGVISVGTDPLQAQLEAARKTLAAQQGVIDVTGQATAANANVINARASTLPQQQAVINASGAVNTAQGQYLNQSRGFIGTQQQQNQARAAEIAGIQNASRNVADLSAVAQAQTARNDQDYKYALAGISKPVEIDVPNGADVANLPPSVRARLQTQEQLLTRDAQAAEARRGITLEGARLALALTATNVDAAQLAAAKVGLSLDQAQLVVQQAEIDAARAGLTIDQYQNQLAQARLNEAAVGLPPAAGLVLYTDPVTGVSEYVTQAVADTRTQVYNTQRQGGQMIVDPATGQAVPAELGSLSDGAVAALAFGGTYGQPIAGAGYQMALDELMRRGYSQTGAAYVIALAQPAPPASSVQIRGLDSLFTPP